MNSLEDLSVDCLGHAGLVHEHVLVSISGGSSCKVSSKTFFLNTKPFNLGCTFGGLNNPQDRFYSLFTQMFVKSSNIA